MMLEDIMNIPNPLSLPDLLLYLTGKVLNGNFLRSSCRIEPYRIIAM